MQLLKISTSGHPVQSEDYQNCVEFNMSENSHFVLISTLWILVCLVVTEAVLENCCAFMPVRSFVQFNIHESEGEDSIGRVPLHNF